MGAQNSKPQEKPVNCEMISSRRLSLSAELSMVTYSRSYVSSNDRFEDYEILQAKEDPKETSTKTTVDSYCAIDELEVQKRKEPVGAILCNATFMGRKSDVIQAQKELLDLPNTVLENSLLVETQTEKLKKLLSDELLEQIPCPLTEEGTKCFIKHLERCYKNNTPTLYNLIELSDETHHVPLLQKLLIQLFPSGKSVALISHDLDNKVTREMMEEILSLTNIAERMKQGHSNCPAFLVGHNFDLLQKKMLNNEEYAKEAFFVLYEKVREKTCERSLKITHNIVHVLLQEAKQQVQSAIRREAGQDIEWTAFQLVTFLKAYSKKNSKPKISEGEYIAIASLFDIRQAQAMEMLKELSQLRLVLHWKSNVIIDIQWLVNAFGEIEAVLSKKCQVIEDCSLLLQDVCEKLCPAASIWIVRFLETLQLSINECNDSDLFSLSKKRLLFCLPNDCTKHGNPFHSSKAIAPIYFRLSVGGIPPGYFQCLISFLSKFSNGFTCIHCVCKSWVVFELRLPSHKDAYHVYLYNRQENYIKVRFSSAPDVDIPGKEACEAAKHIVRSLSEASEAAQRNIASWFAMDSSVSMFLECPDSRCEKEKTHLCRINQQMQRLDCTKNRRYFYLNKCKKEQIHWVKDIVKNFEPLNEDNECSQIDFDAPLPRTESDVSREVDVSLDPSYQRSLVLSQLSDPCTEQEKTKAQVRGRCLSLPQGIDVDKMVDNVLDTYLQQIHECFYPEAEITGFLCQNHILTFDEKRDVLEFEKVTDNKEAAVMTILSAVKRTKGRAKGRGLMGFVEGLAINKMSIGDPHIRLRNTLTNHPQFPDIKFIWIQSEILNESAISV